MILEGDCVEKMRELPESSVDAIVTDPPAGISFMGKPWDGDKGGRNAWVEWLAEVMRECWRVAKPGAHALVWALPRTSHWTGWAIEGAGWEIRDRIVYHFGSGFPKSLNLEGGLGTALKPATEDWWLARKPLIGTVAGNVLEHGTGALNIDGCRIEHDAESQAWVEKWSGHDGHPDDSPTHGKGIGNQFGGSPSGRWPANVALDPEAAAMLDEQAPNTGGGGFNGRGGAFGLGGVYGDTPTSDGARADGRIDPNGGASRFFYCAKSSRGERNAGLDGEKKFTATMGDGIGAREHNPDEPTAWTRNHHPTVKPIDLMRWLVRLVTPPGGTVLDPFAGSGTTGIAAVLEGFNFLGIEREREYAAIARARIEWWSQFPGESTEEILIRAGLSERIEREHSEAGQLGLEL